MKQALFFNERKIAMNALMVILIIGLATFIIWQIMRQNLRKDNGLYDLNSTKLSDLNIENMYGLKESKGGLSVQNTNVSPDTTKIVSSPLSPSTQEMTNASQNKMEIKIDNNASVEAGGEVSQTTTSITQTDNLSISSNQSQTSVTSFTNSNVVDNSNIHGYSTGVNVVNGEVVSQHFSQF